MEDKGNGIEMPEGYDPNDDPLVEQPDGEETPDGQEAADDESKAAEASGKDDKEGKAGDEDFPDKDEYGPKVKKRIGKAIYERNIAREEAAAERAARERLERELAELRRNSGQGEDQNEDLNAKYERLKKERLRAYEDGEIEALDKIEEQLLDVRLEMRQASQAGGGQARQPKKGDNGQPVAPQPHPAAAAWIKSNPWFSNPGFQSYQQRAIDIEHEMLDEGMELSEDFYAELDRRIDAAWPTVRNFRDDGYYDRKPAEAKKSGEQQDNGNPPGKPRKPHKPAASAPAVDEGRPAQSNGRITDADKASMRKYGFDPNNAEHRKAWLDRNML